MGYDKDFYRLYQDYIMEDSVRAAHNWVFDVATRSDKLNSVIDLGCGQSREFFLFARPALYIGVDQNPHPDHDNVVQGDYRELLTFEQRRNCLNPFHRDVTGFVSLFSSEITGIPEQNYELYKTIFEHFPRIECGLVSGFYYISKRDLPEVEEVGGLISHQTIDRIEDQEDQRTEFSEKRIILPVPSKLFGEDVIEVWKIFERNKWDEHDH